MPAHWSIDDASRLYHLQRWGGDYFCIDPQGRLCLSIPAKDRKKSPPFPLSALASTLGEQGIPLPVLVRFDDLLTHRLDRLTQAFATASEQHGYPANYTAIYPIKVNQQHAVIETLVAHGGERLGLEAGSKPELLAIMAMSRPGGTLVCNGYKDREYIQLALDAQAMGHRVFIVIEKPDELNLVLEACRTQQVKARLGVRVRLASLGKGNWQNSGGEKGKFGLTASQLLQLLETLKSRGQLHMLELLHFHMGSQLSDLTDIETGVREAGQFLAELQKAGAQIRVFDVGGGLGVDYEGLGSDHEYSINYRLQDYADTVIRTLAELCRQRDIPPPEVFSESGRGLTAHHAVLITDAIGMEAPNAATGGDEHPLFRGLAQGDPTSLPARSQEASQRYANAMHDFLQQRLDLPQRVAIEEAYSRLSQSLARQGDEASQERVAHKVFLNFSLFQSIPDAWGLGQIFPLLPLENLHRSPNANAVFQDLTCDSDGAVQQYAHSGGIHPSLPVYLPDDDSATPLFGIFLVGAYQEILGDMHNLFGDTHAVNVSLKGDSLELTALEPGDTVEELLDYVHIRKEELLDRLQRKNPHARTLERIKAMLGHYSYFHTGEEPPAS